MAAAKQDPRRRPPGVYTAALRAPALVAQMVGALTGDPEVGGSNLTWPSTCFFLQLKKVVAATATCRQRRCSRGTLSKRPPSGVLLPTRRRTPIVETAGSEGGPRRRGAVCRARRVRGQLLAVDLDPTQEAVERLFNERLAQHVAHTFNNTNNYLRYSWDTHTLAFCRTTRLN